MGDFYKRRVKPKSSPYHDPKAVAPPTRLLVSLCKCPFDRLMGVVQSRKHDTEGERLFQEDSPSCRSHRDVITSIPPSHSQWDPSSFSHPSVVLQILGYQNHRDRDIKIIIMVAKIPPPSSTRSPPPPSPIITLCHPQGGSPSPSPSLRPPPHQSYSSPGGRSPSLPLHPWSRPCTASAAFSPSAPSRPGSCWGEG